MPLGVKPYIDFAFLFVFGRPENSAALVGLLNAVLQYPSPVHAVEILTPFRLEDFYQDKAIVLDVLATDESGRRFNVEMQTTIVASLPQRLGYYAARSHVDQLSRGADYSQLRDTATICLLTQNLFPQRPSQPIHRFVQRDAESGETLPSSVSVHTVELAKYNLDGIELPAPGELIEWVYYFKRAHAKGIGELRRRLSGPGLHEAIQGLAQIRQNARYSEMYDRQEERELDYARTLAAERFYAREEGEARGEARGLSRGLNRGLAQGLARGELVGTIRTFEGLLRIQNTDLAALDANELERLAAELKQRWEEQNG